MARRSLRTGFTTGSCAAAAALGAARMLREQRLIERVELPLPAGMSALFHLEGQAFDSRQASCFVVKDAGDDPDVTHGVEVWAEVTLGPPSPRPSPPRGEGGKDLPPPSRGGGEGEGGSSVIIEGGEGIGKVTKPGLAVPVGEWAINPVPRRMIEGAVRSVYPEGSLSGRLRVVISIPDGEERSRRTLNARLGILGGLSILGTTGVVSPLSHKAWTDTLDAALDVAAACGCRTVVLSTGRTSERAAQAELNLPEEAFIMMGDHLGYALEACHRRGFPNLVLAVQFAKLVKIACGHRQTHVAHSRLDLEELASWARGIGLDGALAKKIELANTAREVYLDLAPGPALTAEVARRGLARCGALAPGATVDILLIGYDGRPAGRFTTGPEGAKEGKR